MATKLFKKEKDLKMLCLVYILYFHIVFSYFVFIIFLTLRVKFVPRKTEFWVFNTGNFFFFS